MKTTRPIIRLGQVLVAFALFAALMPIGTVSAALGIPPNLATVIASGGIDNESVRSMAIDDTGNAYVTGSFNGTADFDGDIGTIGDQHTSSGEDDVFIAAYGPNGEYLWSTTFGGLFIDETSDIAIDAAGNIYLAGYFEGTGDFDGDPATTGDRHVSRGDADAFLVSYDRGGNYRWAVPIGGPGDEDVLSVGVDRSNNVYLTGGFEGTADFDGDDGTVDDRRTAIGSYSAFVASYSDDGNFRWALAAGGPDIDEGAALAVDGAGNTYVTGTFEGTADFDGDETTTDDQHTATGSSGLFIVSYDSAGLYRWVTTTGDVGSLSASSIAVDGLGNTYVTGSVSGTGDFDGDNATTGDRHTASGSGDIFVASYGPSGSYRWVASASGTSGGSSTSIAVDSDGTSYITGSFIGDFDASPTSADTQSGYGGGDIFVAAYSIFGDYLWAITTGGTRSENARSIASTGADTIYVAGDFVSGDGGGAADFDGDLTTTEDQRTSNGDDDLFVLRFAVADVDGDGFDGPLGDGADCNDDDRAINPDATDIAYNGIDEDCDGVDLVDVDGDGSPSNAALDGTPDCNDDDNSINPGAPEVPYNGIDEDCDGADLVDVDGDGSPSNAALGGTPDCNDDDDSIYPGATDTPGDGIDQDCNDVDASSQLCNGLAVTIDMNAGGSGFGTAGDDVIFGTPGDDVIDGMGGDDTICGEGGNDSIYGGDGLDFIYGGDGNDVMVGGEGNDRIRGQQGVDVIHGENGNDFLYGGIEGDTIEGGDGNDTIGGFGGADMIDGGPGNDTIFGGFGADIIDAGTGNDTVFGLIGDDIINGGDGDDTLNGDAGQDTIRGDDGDDILNGGNSLDSLFGGTGDDVLNGGKADDNLSGGRGNDTCSGNKENVADTADDNCELTFGIP